MLGVSSVKDLLSEVEKNELLISKQIFDVSRGFSLNGIDDISVLLGSQLSRVDRLKVLAKGLEKEEETFVMEEQRKHREEFFLLEKEFRKACKDAKANSQRQNELDKEELMGTTAEDKSIKRYDLRKAQKTTDAMKQARDLLQK